MRSTVYVSILQAIMTMQCIVLYERGRIQCQALSIALSMHFLIELMLIESANIISRKFMFDIRYHFTPKTLN